MEFTALVSIFDENLWHYHLPVPLPIAEHFKSISKDNRVICTLNNEVKIHAAIMPKGGTYYLMLSKDLRKKLGGVEAGDMVQVQMEKDESKYGTPMPEEMQEALYADPEADELFHQLTPGKQRTLIHLVSKVKSSNKRIEKAIVILEHLRQHHGMIDFKQLNIDFKEANNRNW